MYPAEKIRPKLLKPAIVELALIKLVRNMQKQFFNNKFCSNF